MPQYNQKYKTSLCILILSSIFFFACRKVANENKYFEIVEAKNVFYSDTLGLDITLSRLVQSFENQKKFNAQLPDFIKRNGKPIWNKTIYSKIDNKKGIENSNVKTNSLNPSEILKADSTRGVFLIPLKSESTGNIQSYIAAIKDTDSSYKYRLYNRDSLARIHTENDTTKTLLTTTEAIFAIFEKSINNRDTINISGTIIRNASLQFQSSNLSYNRINSNSIGVKSNNTCFFSLTISVYYEQVMYSYMYGPPVYRPTSIQINIDMICWEETAPQDFQPDNTGGGGNWWDYGTGWPWSSIYSSTQPNPWQYWWNGYTLPFDPYSPSNLAAYAASLGNFWENPQNDAVLGPYDPAIDGPAAPDGTKKRGPLLQYSGGKIQNYTDGAGVNYATFTDDNTGFVTVFPEVTITPLWALSNAAWTSSTGTIHAHFDVDLATLEHEYGHYLYSKLVGSLVYNVTVVPSSLYSATSDPSRHKYFWTEYVANWQAINFFGNNSAIGLRPDRFPR